MYVFEVDKDCFESLKSRSINFLIPDNDGKFKIGDYVRIQEKNENDSFTGRYLNGIVKTITKHEKVAIPHVIISLASISEQQYFTTERKKSCRNCIHGTCNIDKINNDSQKVKLDTVCLALDYNTFIDLLWDGDYTYLANKCGKYSPVLVESCDQCGKPINKPAFEHEFWSIVEDVHPCCDKECVQIMDAYFDIVFTMQGIVDGESISPNETEG